MDREYAIARRSHEYLLQHPTWPTEWILQALSIAWYDYLYTGDSRSLESSYELLKPRILMALREKNGLISTTTGLQTDDFLRSIRFKGQIRDIVDWPHTGILGLGKKQGGEDDGFAFTDYNVVTNAWHYAALKQMEGIAGALGKQDDVAFYASESDAFKNGSSVRSLMFARGISRMVLLPTPTMLPYMAICSRWRSIWFRPERSKMSSILSKPAGWLAASMARNS